MLRLKEDNWKIEILNCKEVREQKLDWTHPRFLVDWLLESTLHFILCQGIHCGFFGIWCPADCVKEIIRLEFHSGFPSGASIRCPVFNGDKYRYLAAVPTFVNKSFRISLVSVSALQKSIHDATK